MGLNLGALARGARKWIGLALNWYRTNRMTLNELIGSNRRLRKVLKRADKLEATIGAHTAAWSAIADAAKHGNGLALSPENVAYLAKFKEDVWDRLWKPFKDEAANAPDTPELDEPPTDDPDDEEES